MKTLTFLFCISINCFAQQDSIKKIVEEEGIVECFPELFQIVGGIDSVQSRLQYPIKAIEHSIEGNVIILVNIDSLGILLSTKIIRGLGFGCDEKSIRLVRTSKYLPAIQNGKAIQSEAFVRIKFKLPEK